MSEPFLEAEGNGYRITAATSGVTLERLGALEDGKIAIPFNELEGLSVLIERAHAEGAAGGLWDA